MVEMNIFETAFDVAYLITIFTLGVLIFKKTKISTTFRLFSYMAFTLGIGDCFHLIPRILDYWVLDCKFAMSVGGAITAVTMTFFYVILWNMGCRYYKINSEKKEKGDIFIWIMTTLRIIIIICPQNEWGSTSSPYFWNIIRNIPFCIIGIFLVIFFYKNEKDKTNSPFKNLWLAIALSYAFYIPVFLFSNFIGWIGSLMALHTIMFVWITYMGYKAATLDKKK